MKNLLLLILFICFSCTQNKHEKPFVVIDKGSIVNSSDLLLYTYEDKNGYEITFVDSVSKYEIGDTIK